MKVSTALGELILILEERGTQYGNEFDDKANLRESIRVGIDPTHGVIIRAGDKWGRVCNLTYTAMVDNSSWAAVDIKQLRDNMLDLAGYMIKGVELLDERPMGFAIDEAFADGASQAAGLESLDNADPEPQQRRGIRSLLGWEPRP